MTTTTAQGHVRTVEEHAARRQLRSKRVKPILDSLAAAQSYSAQSQIDVMVEKARKQRRPLTRDELTSLIFSVSLVVQNMAGLLVRGRLPWVTAS